MPIIVCLHFITLIDLEKRDAEIEAKIAANTALRRRGSCFKSWRVHNAMHCIVVFYKVACTPYSQFPRLTSIRSESGNLTSTWYLWHAVSLSTVFPERVNMIDAEAFSLETCNAFAENLRYS